MSDNVEKSRIYPNNELFCIFNKDCAESYFLIKSNSINLCICDPPFGINETRFRNFYNRNNSNIIDGYLEAPDDYETWTLNWMKECRRILVDNGSLFIIMGHSNLRHVLNAAANLGLHLVNHIIWKYNFGVNTKNKFVTSHYHVLYYIKNSKVKPVFNLNCRYGYYDIAEDGGKLLYDDLEDIWYINKEFMPNCKKNQNKLPEELVRKIIQYTSNVNDWVCDFFMGNFTTAYAALKLGRRVCGFEINSSIYNYHMPQIAKIQFGCDLQNTRVINMPKPLRQGKPITPEEASSIILEYNEMLSNGKKKKDIYNYLQDKYQRGFFAIKNILTRKV